MLSPHEQWLIHYYYQPLDNDATDAELLAHRHALSKWHKGLPQEVGRLVSKIERGGDVSNGYCVEYKVWSCSDLRYGVAAYRTVTTRTGNILISGRQNVDVDPEQLVQVILAIAAQEDKQPADREGSIDTHGSQVVDTKADDYKL